MIAALLFASWIYLALALHAGFASSFPHLFQRSSQRDLTEGAKFEPIALRLILLISAIVILDVLERPLGLENLSLDTIVATAGPVLIALSIRNQVKGRNQTPGVIRAFDVRTIGGTALLLLAIFALGFLATSS